MADWSQPCCEDCWVRLFGARRPRRVTAARFNKRTCALCGRPTNSGIYVRADPAAVRYPAPDQEGEHDDDHDD